MSRPLLRPKEFRGQWVNRTNSKGRSVVEAWIHLFQKNEEKWAAGKCAGVKTDEEITMQMLDWFPDRIYNEILYDVVRVRARYNRGALAPQKGQRPKVKSYRYMLLPKKQLVRATAKGGWIGEPITLKKYRKTDWSRGQSQESSMKGEVSDVESQEEVHEEGQQDGSQVARTRGSRQAHGEPHGRALGGTPEGERAGEQGQPQDGLSDPGRDASELA